jgi:hypothetical protein
MVVSQLTGFILDAYFTQATVDLLGTIDDIPGAGTLQFPRGMFQSTRIGRNRKSEDPRNQSDEAIQSQSSTVTREAAPSPSSKVPSREHRMTDDHPTSSPPWPPAAFNPVLGWTFDVPPNPPTRQWAPIIRDEGVRHLPPLELPMNPAPRTGVDEEALGTLPRPF